MKPLTIFGIIGAGLAVSYTAVYLKKQAELLKKTIFSYSGGRILNFGLSNIRLLLRFKIENKSNTNLTIINQKYEVSIGDKVIANLKSNKQTSLLANAESFMDFEVSFNPATIIVTGIKNIKNYFLDKSKIFVKTTGEVSVKSGILFFNSIKVNVQSSLADFGV